MNHDRLGMTIQNIFLAMYVECTLVYRYCFLQSKREDDHVSRKKCLHICTIYQKLNDKANLTWNSLWSFDHPIQYRIDSLQYIYVIKRSPDV